MPHKTTRLQAHVRDEMLNLVVVGASAGGPGSIAEILKQLSDDFNGAIVVVQHLDASFSEQLVSWWSQQTSLPVRLATHGEYPQPGTVLVAHGGKHLEMNIHGMLVYRENVECAAYEPSIDVFFSSVVRHWKGNVTGVILTGMGADGAKGLRALRLKGHHTIVQAREGCVVYGMPKAAEALKAGCESVPLERIAQAIRNAMMIQARATKKKREKSEIKEVS
jgi:two-component system response regulator WspF